MASYFDEHDCSPLGPNEAPDNELHLARMLVDSGIAEALGMSFEEAVATQRDHALAPPTSKSWLREEVLSDKNALDAEGKGTAHQCPICLKEFSKSGGEDATDSDKNKKTTAIRLPHCGHTFHRECALAWLERTSSCPLCRHELPTDDAQYEEFKRQRKRSKQRQADLETLHDAMFS